MKKLLGLLGAVGLVASSSAVVVACGDTPTDEFAKTFELSKTKTSDTYDIADVTLAEGVELKTDLKEDSKLEVTFAEKAKADTTKSYTMTVKVKDDSVATFSETFSVKNGDVVVAKFKVNFTGDKAELKDISGITMPAVKVGADMAAVKADIKTEIDKLVSGTVLDTDYTITGGTSLAGTIEVKAKADSKLISGSFSITVESEAVVKKDISGIQIADVKVDTDIADVQANIKAEIDKLVSGTVLDTDYKITGNTDQPGKITVKAEAESLLLTGEFEINVVA